VTIIWAPQSGTSTKGMSRRVQAPHLQAVRGPTLEVWGIIMSSPSGVRGRAPAAIDFSYIHCTDKIRLQQLSISIRTVKYSSLSVVSVGTNPRQQAKNGTNGVLGELTFPGHVLKNPDCPGKSGRDGHLILNRSV